MALVQANVLLTLVYEVSICLTYSSYMEVTYQRAQDIRQPGCLRRSALCSHTASRVCLTLLNGPLQPVLLPGFPSGVLARRAGVLEATLHDLHPVTGTIVVGNTSRCLGNVHETRAGVLNEFVVENFEAELVTRLDSVGSGLLVQRALVASKVVGVHELAGDGGVVRVRVLANVGIFASDVGAVDDQPVEDIMRVGTERRKQREKSNGLHVANKIREGKGANVLDEIESR
jgi:hypothetical protein